MNRICGLMVRILASSAVDRWGQINDYKKNLVVASSPLNTQH